MQTIKVSPAQAGNTFYKRILTVLFAAVFMLPAAAYCQEEEQSDQPVTRERPSVESPSVSDTRNGIWQNSGNPTGTRDNSSTATAGTATARPGEAARPSGAVADGRDPGGNPDVPFDPNMNLAFLVAGIGFAYIIFRKRFKLATVAK